MAKLRDQLRKQKQELRKRQDESYERRTSGGNYVDFFDDEKIPKGVEKWKGAEGMHIVDIIPFIAGKNYPDKRLIGKPVYVVDIWVHKNVGSGNVTYVCPSRNFKEPCPLCEYISNAKKTGNLLSKKEYVAVAPKRRVVYLVWVHDNEKEEKKGIQIYDVAHFFLGEPLDEAARLPARAGVSEGGSIPFMDVDEGMSVCWTRKGGDSNTKFIGHKFIEREEPIPDEIIEQSFSLDECIKMHPDYDEMSEMFYGGGSSKEREEESHDGEETDDDEVSGTGECFGVDNGRLADCETCKLYDSCYDETYGDVDQYEDEPEPEPEPEPVRQVPRRPKPERRSQPSESKQIPEQEKSSGIRRRRVR